MAENDNKNRPVSSGSQGAPEKSFSTNNTRIIQENNSSRRTDANKTSEKSNQTSEKKGK